ncbi:MAG: transcriptional regulator [Nitrospiria bacterium]
MDAMDRRIAMLRRGITQARIARELGVSGATVSLVVGGRMKSRRVEEAIADALGISRAVLWPDRVES